MNAPQLIVIGILAMNLGITLGTMAVSRDKKISDLVGQVIVAVIWIGVLAWGGFWK